LRRDNDRFAGQAPQASPKLKAQHFDHGRVLEFSDKQELVKWAENDDNSCRRLLERVVNPGNMSIRMQTRLKAPTRARVLTRTRCFAPPPDLGAPAFAAWFLKANASWATA
jgi:hypothetical protein